MMKIVLVIPVFMLALFCLHSAVAQTSNTDRYINYPGYFQETFKAFGPDKKNDMPRPYKQLLNETVLIKDETPLPAGMFSPEKRKTKRLEDEEVFSKSRKSVFIIGKLYQRPTDTAVNFDLMATAFAISSEGICVTNYHVLQDLIRGQNKNGDSVYFIMSSDRKVYLLNSILTYSQNNDLAIFKVNTRGDQLASLPLGKYAPAGTAAFCISHPDNHFFYFSKGMVARNIVTDASRVVTGFNTNGRPPIRMEISTDYGLGSSGGPILDKCGNLIGIVSTTTSINDLNNLPQMVVKDAIPVNALKELLKIDPF